MNPIAIYSGSTVLYWSSVIIVFGLLASLVLSLSLQRVNGGSSAAMLLFFPLAIILSVPICRVIHWYCHFEQYNGIWGALTDYSTGSYCLPGALLGVWLAALIVKKLGFERSIARLLDAPIMTTTLPYDEDEDLEYITDPELIDEKFGDIVDLVIDGGIGGIEPSTVVKCTEDEPEIVRQGKGWLEES